MSDMALPPARTGLNDGALTRRNVIVGGTLAAASALAFARQPVLLNQPIPHERFNAWVPNQIGGWRFATASGVILPPPDQTSDRLYDNLVTRVYVLGEQAAIMLLIAYNNTQDGVLQVHRPEVCYPAGGYALSPTLPYELTEGFARPLPSNIFTATGPRRTEHVLYWTRIGGEFPRSWTEQRMAVVRANLNGGIPDGIMMRVSMTGLEQDAAMTMMRRFVGEFMAAAPRPLRRVLVG